MSTIYKHLTNMHPYYGFRTSSVPSSSTRTTGDCKRRMHTEGQRCSKAKHSTVASGFSGARKRSEAAMRGNQIFEGALQRRYTVSLPEWRKG